MYARAATMGAFWQKTSGVVVRMLPMIFRRIFILVDWFGYIDGLRSQEFCYVTAAGKTDDKCM